MTGHYCAETPPPWAPSCRLQPPETLVVEVDGAMVPTRGADPWREVKVGLVARGEHFVQNKGRGLVTQARFVARLGDYEGFKQVLTDALTLERAADSVRQAFPDPWLRAFSVKANDVAPIESAVLTQTRSLPRRSL